MTVHLKNQSIQCIRDQYNDMKRPRLSFPLRLCRFSPDRVEKSVVVKKRLGLKQ